MKKLLVTLLLVVAFYQLQAQEYLAAAKSNGRWGFINPKGEWVITALFDDAANFSEGLARVRVNKRWGYIDNKGNWVIKPVFLKAKDFMNGNAPAYAETEIIPDKPKSGGPKWGVIDTTGAWIIKPKYDFTDYFWNGFARVKDISWHLVNRQGIEITTVDFTHCHSFNDGLAKVKVKNGWCFIDTTGLLVIDAKFKSIGNFCDGLAWAESDNKFGYIDMQGNWAVKPQYDEVRNFSEGKGRVFVDKHWSFIDKTGKVILTLEKGIKEVGSFKNGFARVRKSDIGFIDTNGQPLGKSKYFMVRDFNMGVAIVKERDYGLIDTLGNVIIKPVHLNLEMSDNGLLKVKTQEDLLGFLDLKGNWVIKPVFEDLKIFVNVDNRRRKKFYPTIRFGPSLIPTYDPNDFR